MPELPEVEVTKQGISPLLLNKKIVQIDVINGRLRWPVPKTITDVEGQVIRSIRRRAKYLFLDTLAGTIIIHLGMSGSLRVVSQSEPRQPHDHIDLVVEGGKVLRYRDPRRFGCWLWTQLPPEQHSLIEKLGPEPLSDAFSPQYLLDKLSKSKRAIKVCLMENKIVVGVGNIYATEALFYSGILPTRAANTLSLDEVSTLVAWIKKILANSIEQGGSSLKDFIKADGKPGYFAQTLAAYGRGGQKCITCQCELQLINLGQRATVYCPVCQQ